MFKGFARMNVLMNTPINGVNVKPREFFICDETDNSGYSVMEWSEKEAKRQFGSCNVFHVIEYSEIDRLKDVMNPLGFFIFYLHTFPRRDFHDKELSKVVFQ